VTLPNKIRMLARTSDYSLRELAALADITPSCLSRYFAGKAQLRSDSLVRLLKALKIDLDEYLDQRVAERVAMSQPANFDEALVYAFNLLPSLTKRRQLRLLLRQLTESCPRQDRLVQSVVRNLSFHCGTLDLRQEA
jgi:transcriptional regulator with XRE-family HTH domain